MKLTHTVTSLLGVALCLAPTAFAFFDAPSSEELRDDYPDLESARAGNRLILCPFLRMLERSGRIDEADDNTDEDQSIQTRDLKQAADDFGCDTTTACGPVIDTVCAGQTVTDGFSWAWFNPFRSKEVDLERLWDAPPISHDCGFTFAKGKGDEGVSDERLASTLAKLAGRADENGQLVYQDILDTKNEICDEENVDITAAGLTEAKLIFAYLGGVERGFVDYDDVEGFLQVDSQMPLTKAEKCITAFYLLQVN